MKLFSPKLADAVPVAERWQKASFSVFSHLVCRNIMCFAAPEGCRREAGKWKEASIELFLPGLFLFSLSGWMVPSWWKEREGRSRTTEKRNGRSLNGKYCLILSCQSLIHVQGDQYSHFAEPKLENFSIIPIFTSFYFFFPSQYKSKIIIRVIKWAYNILKEKMTCISTFLSLKDLITFTYMKLGFQKLLDPIKSHAIFM